MKILITGGAGFIGSHLAERLAESAELILLDNFRRNSLRHMPSLVDNSRVTVCEADVLDLPLVLELTRGVDVIIHLAAIAGVSSYYEESLKTLRVNILGTLNLLEASVQNNIRQFIDFSTSEVFGPEAMWVSELSMHVLGPVSERRWVYATSKLASEHFTLRFGEEHGFAVTCVRPFNIYGPRQTGEGAVSNFCRAAVLGKPLIVYGDGSAIRAWCYVSDLVDAVEAILQTRSSAGQVFNIGNPREVETTLNLARRIVRLVPSASIETQSTNHAEVLARVPAIEKARKVLSYEPQVDLDEGLGRTLAWFREVSS